MNAPELNLVTGQDMPEFIKCKEPAAVYMWLSTKRMIVSKGEDQIDLSADDLRELVRFVDGCTIEEQL